MDSYVFYHEGGELKPHGVQRPYSVAAGWYYRAMYYRTEAFSDWGPFDTAAKATKALQRHNIHRHWAQLWFKAMENMPPRTSYKVEWRPREKPTPIGEFIKGEIKGKLQLISGVVYEKYNIHTTMVGQTALACVMGYNLKRGGHNQLYVNMMRGSRPKDPAQQKLLKQLADVDGTELARELLIEKGRPARWYI